jgi:hypothetical protein
MTSITSLINNRYSYRFFLHCIQPLSIFSLSIHSTEKIEFYNCHYVNYVITFVGDWQQNEKSCRTCYT